MNNSMYHITQICFAVGDRDQYVARSKLYLVRLDNVVRKGIVHLELVWSEFVELAQTSSNDKACNTVFGKDTQHAFPTTDSQRSYAYAYYIEKHTVPKLESSIPEYSVFVEQVQQELRLSTVFKSQTIRIPGIGSFQKTPYLHCTFNHRLYDGKTWVTITDDDDLHLIHDVDSIEEGLNTVLDLITRAPIISHIDLKNDQWN